MTATDPLAPWSASSTCTEPMNAIVGYTRILLRRAQGGLDDRQYRNLQSIDISARNLLSLINDILDLSKIEAGRIDIVPADVDLQRLVDECLQSVESLVQPGVALQRQLQSVRAVRTDADRLRRVLINLLSNAVKFTRHGSITLSLQPAGDDVEIAVADTGVGIPPEALPHISDEFRQVAGAETAAVEGTGLGLAIVRKSVELLGGTIEARSEVGGHHLHRAHRRLRRRGAGGGLSAASGVPSFLRR